MASLLEGGPSSVPVEFVQNQPESYPTTRKTATNNTVSYSQDPAAKTNLTSSVPLHHSVTQSLGNTSQQHQMAMEGNQSGSEVAVTPPVVAGTADLRHVLSGLQQSGELNSVLQQQPQLVDDLSAIAAGEVSMDPENLRFQYEVEEAEVTMTKSSKRYKPLVYREQDRFLPIHNVARIMRNAIPRNGKVSKDAKECMQECVSEFISFITSEASDKCIAEKRKTITGDDILVAMATLGFDNYVEPLKLYLQKYREFTKAEKIAGNGGNAAGTGLTRQSSLTGTGAAVVGQQQGSGMSGSDVIGPGATVYTNSTYGGQIQQLPNAT